MNLRGKIAHCALDALAGAAVLVQQKRWKRTGIEFGTETTIRRGERRTVDYLILTDENGVKLCVEVYEL